MKFYSVVKKMKFVGICVELENIILRQVSINTIPNVLLFVDPEVNSKAREVKRDYDG